MTSAPNTTKQRLNLSLDAPLVGAAKALGVNISAVAEAALREAGQSAAQRAWQDENREALKAKAADIAANGLWSDGRRLF